MINIVNEVEEPSDSAPLSISRVARDSLLETTALLEALRTCEGVVRLIQVFTLSPPNNFPLLHTNPRYAPNCPKSLNSAHFTSIYALLHSYAKSYRMCIEVAKMVGGGFGKEAVDFLKELSKMSQKAPDEVATNEKMPVPAVNIAAFESTSNKEVVILNEKFKNMFVSLKNNNSFLLEKIVL